MSNNTNNIIHNNQYEYIVEKTIGENVVYFSATLDRSRNVVVSFTVNGSYYLSEDSDKQHPAICRFVLRSFKEAKVWADKYGYRFSFSPSKGDSHEQLRKKAYRKVSQVEFCGQYYWFSKNYLKQLATKMLVGAVCVTTVVAIPTWFHHQVQETATINCDMDPQECN